MEPDANSVCPQPSYHAPEPARAGALTRNFPTQVKTLRFIPYLSKPLFTTGAPTMPTGALHSRALSALEPSRRLSQDGHSSSYPPNHRSQVSKDKASLKLLPVPSPACFPPWLCISSSRAGCWPVCITMPCPLSLGAAAGTVGAQ